jgi:hypothetical protein
MAVYAIVIMVILAIIMAVFIVLSILKEDSNNKKNQHNIIYPFNAKLQSRDTDHPDGAQSVNLVASDGKTPQLQCPANTHIEVIGAWVDVVDPNGICSFSPSSTFKLSCGFTDDVSAGVTCQADTDCAPGMECSGSQQCVPKPCSSNDSCGTTACTGDNQYVGNPCDDMHNDGTNVKYPFTSGGGLVCIGGIIHKDPSGGQCLYCDTRRWDGPAPEKSGDPIGYCAQSPSCANTGETGASTPQNPICAGICIPRDASAYLAAQCDGNRTCSIKWNPSDPTYFGPKPCDIDVVWDGPPGGPGAAGGDVSTYQNLPVAAGWGGGQPGSGQYEGSQSQPSTYSQGFYVHGIYNCVPDST